MKAKLPEVLEAGRQTEGMFGTLPDCGPYGKFKVRGPCGEHLTIVASGADFEECKGWEHVSVSTYRRIPNWTEMCFVKGLFWDDEEVGVFQYHPPKSEYVSNMQYCLHLWRYARPDKTFNAPPSILVGKKELGENLSQPKLLDLARRKYAGEDI